MFETSSSVAKLQQALRAHSVWVCPEPESRIGVTAQCDIVDVLHENRSLFEKAELRTSETVARHLIEAISAKNLTCGEIVGSVDRLIETYHAEVESSVYLIPPSRKHRFICMPGEIGDPDKSPLGQDIHSRFPEAVYDLIESHNCFVFGRFTATVLHLMRALENGLGVFCLDLGVKEGNNWQESLERIVSQINGMANAANKPDDWRKRRQFYSQVTSHLSNVKTAWRNPTMHGHLRYSEPEADAMLTNVMAFMKQAATFPAASLPSSITP